MVTHFFEEFEALPMRRAPDGTTMLSFRAEGDTYVFPFKEDEIKEYSRWVHAATGARVQPATSEEMRRATRDG